MSSGFTLSFFYYRPRNILVYNCTTGGINPFHWGEVGRSLVSPKPDKESVWAWHQRLCNMICYPAWPKKHYFVFVSDGSMLVVGSLWGNKVILTNFSDQQRETMMAVVCFLAGNNFTKVLLKVGKPGCVWNVGNRFCPRLNWSITPRTSESAKIMSN